MKTNYLFPHTCKKIGWLMFCLGLLSGCYYLFINEEPPIFDLKLLNLYSISLGDIANEYFITIENNFLDEITSLLLIIGGLLIAFSKEKIEDEFIQKLRLNALAWATYVNYGVLIIAILFIFGMSFFWVLVFNMFTLIVIFLIRFNWLLKQNKMVEDEE